MNLPASDPAWLDCRDPKITLLKEISIDGVDGTYFDANLEASLSLGQFVLHVWPDRVQAGWLLTAPIPGLPSRVCGAGHAQL